MIEINVLQFWLGVFVLLLGGIGTTIRAVYSIEGRFDTIVKEQDAKLNKAKEEGDEKRRRIYERFDEYKCHIESNFVRRDMCGLMHNETSKIVTALVQEIKELKRELSEVKAIVIGLQAEKKNGVRE